MCIVRSVGAKDKNSSVFLRGLLDGSRGIQVIQAPFLFYEYGLPILPGINTQFINLMACSMLFPKRMALNSFAPQTSNILQKGLTINKIQYQNRPPDKTDQPMMPYPFFINEISRLPWIYLLYSSNALMFAKNAFELKDRVLPPRSIPSKPSLHLNLKIQLFLPVESFRIDVISALQQISYHHHPLIQISMMLSVLPEPSSHQEQHSLQVEPTLSEAEDVSLKQVLKPKKLFTPLNITIIVALIAVVGFGTFYLLNTEKEIDIKSSINQSHGKIIENADSSKKDGSNSGSSSSKTSSTNDKPNTKSLPASKNGAITSNPGLMGKGGDEPDPNDEDNGDKRDKKLRGGSTSGGSTDEDSEQEEQEEEGEEAIEEGTYWVDTKLEGNNASPLVGSARP